MSLDATRWAWQQVCRPTHKLVLLSLADRAGENHECHPSMKRLHLDTGLYRETIMEAISALEKAGLISVVRVNGRGNRYTLVGVTCRHNQSEKADQSVNTDQSEKADSTSLEKPTTTSRQKPIQNLSVESTKNQKKKDKSNGLDFSCWPCLPSEQALKDWIAMRKRIKADVSQTVVTAFGKELTKALGLGYSVEDCIAECVTSNWRGFKAQWMSNRNGATQHPHKSSEPRPLMKEFPR